jgi:hypothetical protein
MRPLTQINKNSGGAGGLCWHATCLREEEASGMASGMASHVAAGIRDKDLPAKNRSVISMGGTADR